MADIQTALARVLDEWEGKADNAAPQPEATQKPKAHLFKPTTGVTKATFNFVRANPGINRVEATKLLVMQGYKEGSVASLITAFIKQEQMELVDGKLFTTVNEYQPLKDSKAVREDAIKKAKLAKRKAAAEARAARIRAEGAGITALQPLQPQPTPAPRSTIITTNFNVENVIKNLTIYQAKELRDALNNLFK